MPSNSAACRHLLFGILLASSTVACGPRISQWVQVTDCAQKHVVMPNAKVYVYEGFADDASIGPTVGVRTQGGATDSVGNTWGSFPVESGSKVKAFLTEDINAEHAKQQFAQVPANPTEPVHMCVNK
jgi:hypothetical protein